MNATITYDTPRIAPARPPADVPVKQTDRHPPAILPSGTLVRVTRTEAPEELPVGTVLLMYRAGKAHVVKHQDHSKLGVLVPLAPRRGEPPCPVIVEQVPAGEKVEVA